MPPPSAPSRWLPRRAGQSSTSPTAARSTRPERLSGEMKRLWRSGVPSPANIKNEDGLMAAVYKRWPSFAIGNVGPGPPPPADLGFSGRSGGAPSTRRTGLARGRQPLCGRAVRRRSTVRCSSRDRHPADGPDGSLKGSATVPSDRQPVRPPPRRDRAKPARARRLFSPGRRAPEHGARSPAERSTRQKPRGRPYYMAGAPTRLSTAAQSSVQRLPDGRRPTRNLPRRRRGDADAVGPVRVRQIVSNLMVAYRRLRAATRFPEGLIRSSRRPSPEATARFSPGRQDRGHLLVPCP
jgi:hypothetical protein